MSKPDSVSSLSVLDDSEKCDSRPFVNAELLNGVVAMLRVSFNMALFGVDIVVEKNTGHYAIIDINAFPGINKEIVLIIKSSKNNANPREQKKRSSIKFLFSYLFYTSGSQFSSKVV